MEEESDTGFVGVFVEVINPVGVNQAGAAFNAVDDVAFVEQEFSEVGPILAGNTGNEGNFGLCSHCGLVSTLCILEKVGIGKIEADFKFDLRLPAQGFKAAAVHELFRGAVGFAGVEDDVPGITDGLADGMGKFFDGDV